MELIFLGNFPHPLKLLKLPGPGKPTFDQHSAKRTRFWDDRWSAWVMEKPWINGRSGTAVSWGVPLKILKYKVINGDKW